MVFSVLRIFFLFLNNRGIIIRCFVFFCIVPLIFLVSSGDVSYIVIMESEIALPLCGLTLWVGGIRILISRGLKLFYNQFKGGIIFLIFLLLCRFITMDGVLFYVLFESCLVPTSFLVVCWGHTPEREEATLYMIFYTVIGGSLHMVGLIGINYFFGTTSFLRVVNIGRRLRGKFWARFW